MSEYEVVQVRVPRALADALQAEALRRLTTRSRVAADVLCKALPDYLAEEVRRDLAGPRIVDVEPRAVEVRR